MKAPLPVVTMGDLEAVFKLVVVESANVPPPLVRGTLRHSLSELGGDFIT